MKQFLGRSNGNTHLSNITTCLLCTSYLFIGYMGYINNVDNLSKPVKTDTLVVNDTEVVSQIGNKKDEPSKTKVAVVKTKAVKATGNYVPAKYDAVTGDAIVNYAMRYVGLRYVSAGNSLKTGTDCSGFTKLIYKEFGVTLARTVSAQMKNGTYVKKSDLKKGDLVFYGYGNGVPRHVALYIGNGKIIHESNSRDGVKISSVNILEYLQARRVINDNAIKIVEQANKKEVEESSEKIESSDPTVDNNQNVEENVKENENMEQTETKEEINTPDVPSTPSVPETVPESSNNPKMEEKQESKETPKQETKVEEPIVTEENNE